MVKKFFYLCLTVAVVALSACSDDDQSSFNFDNVKGKAVISGKVSYSPGYVKNDAGSIMQKEIANGAIVTVEVDNSEYLGSAVGSKTYQTTADENGNYSIEIPVGAKSIQAKVSVKDYEGTYSEYVNSSLLTISGVKYSTSSPYFVSVSDGKTSNRDIELTSIEQPTVNSRNLKALLKGSVVAPVEKFTYNSEKEATGLTSGNEGLANAKVALTFSNNSDSRVIRYETTTSAKGEFSLTANLFDNWNMNSTSVRLEVLASTGTITHNYRDYTNDYYKYIWHSQPVSVYYNPAYTTASLQEKNSVVVYNFGEIYQSFTVTSDKSEIKGVGNDVDYDKNGNRLYYYNDPLYLNHN